MLHAMTIISLFSIAAAVPQPVSNESQLLQLQTTATLRPMLPQDWTAWQADDIDTVYGRLLSESPEKAVRTLSRMSPSIQSAVWMRHFREALVAHPEFTAEERAVMYEAVGLLTPQFFALTPDSPAWSEVVEQPLRALRAKAVMVFMDRHLARELFTAIGPLTVARPETNSTTQAEPDTEAIPRRPPETESVYPDCHCSTESDYCEWRMVGSLGNYKCQNTWCNFANTGCGTLGRFACDGICKPT